MVSHELTMFHIQQVLPQMLGACICLVRFSECIYLGQTRGNAVTMAVSKNVLEGEVAVGAESST